VFFGGKSARRSRTVLRMLPERTADAKNQKSFANNQKNSEKTLAFSLAV
jgi:hypothetical protein